MDQDKKSPATTDTQLNSDVNTASRQVLSGGTPANKEPSKMPFGNYLRSTVLYIVIPLMAFVVNANFRGLVWLITALLSPALFASMLYGVFLLFKRDKVEIDQPTPMQINTRLSYKAPTIVLIVGLVMWVIVGYIFIMLETSGNSGSMAGIAAYPFMFCGVILVALAIIMFLLRYAHNHSLSDS
jgi:hypothetical protein